MKEILGNTKLQSSEERIYCDGTTEEDQILGVMSEAAKREGVLDHEASLRLLDCMKNAVAPQ